MVSGEQSLKNEAHVMLLLLLSTESVFCHRSRIFVRCWWKSDYTYYKDTFGVNLENSLFWLV
jgi:hypothetical protein